MSVEEFDVIIASTGLSESILAAALAKAGQRVLQLDSGDSYGGPDKSLTLNELHTFIHASSHDDAYLHRSGTSAIPPSLESKSRRFNLSLRPTLVPAMSPFVDTLIESGASNYSGFRLLEALAVSSSAQEEGQGRLQRMPCSKEEIFNSKEMTLLEKRKLMKFLQFAVADQQSDQESIGGLLHKFGLSGYLFESVLHSICFADSAQEDANAVLGRLKKYLKSGGRYGSSPFLVGQYGGSSELLQGFCRMCAVYGGLTMLNTPFDPSTFKPGETLEIPQLGAVHAKHLITRSQKSTSSTARAVLVLDRPLALTSSASVALRNADVDAQAETGERQAESGLVVFLPTEDRGCVRAVMHGEGTFTAPDGIYVVYLACEGKATGEAKAVLEPVTRALLESISPEALLYEAYWTDSAPVRPTLHGDDPQAPAPAPAAAAAAAEEATIPLSEISDAAVQDAQRLFGKIVGEGLMFEQREQQQESTAS